MQMFVRVSVNFLSGQRNHSLRKIDIYFSDVIQVFYVSRVVVVAVVVCLASGWGWLSIATPSAARPEESIGDYEN